MSPKRFFIASAAIIAAEAVMMSFQAKADEGMWMINAINSALEKKMQERGLVLSAGEIYNADAEGATVSDAVVSLDFGCTGSIISDKGLLITNHHCAYSDVHSISTDDNNYLEDGFWAMQSSDEVHIPGKSAFFLKRVIDVTDETKALLEEAAAKGQTIGSRRLSSIMEKKYSRETGLEAWFSSMWKGSRYYIALYEVYRDIRLVAAPPVSIAAFGGDIDNWEWPQHKCDFALYRVYMSPEGKPAEYSEDNVPLVPERKLEISLDGYRPGDFTMVIGYPGSTDRYSSSFEVDYEERVALPISNEIRKRQMDIIRGWMEKSPAIRLKYSDYYFGLSNIQELNEGEVLCFRRFNVVEEKQEQERELQEWICSDPQRKAKWGSLLSLLEEKYRAVEDIKRNTVIYRETLIRGNMISRACTKVNSLRSEVLECQGLDGRRIHGAEDNPEVKKCCRNFRFCGRRFKAVTVSMKRDYEKFIVDVEHDLFRYSVERFYESISPEWLGEYQKELKTRFSGNNGKCDYDALTAYLWDSSFFTDSTRFSSFVSEEHTIEEYCADPLFRFFNDIRITDFNSRVAEIEGGNRILDLSREYTHAMYCMRMDKGEEQYPDANSTMRITYGTVGGIEPYDAVIASWRSTPAGILEKYNPESYEFNLDSRQKDLLERQDWGRWGFAEGQGKKDMPGNATMYVDFLTDNDITGGNSGSPVLNAEGKLIGLAFDGNKESLASDAAYVDGYNKCVCADIRFVLWTLDKYAGMDRILKEIGF